MLKLHIYLFKHKKLKLKFYIKALQIVYNIDLSYIGIFQSKPLHCPQYF